MQRKSWMMLLAQCTPNPKAIAQKPQMQTHSAEGGLHRQGKARCCCMCIANCTAGTVCMMQWVMCKLHSKQYIQMHHSACVQYSECSQIARRSMHCGQCGVEAMQNTVNKGFSSLLLDFLLPALDFHRRFKLIAIVAHKLLMRTLEAWVGAGKRPLISNVQKVQKKILRLVNFCASGEFCLQRIGGFG